MKKRNKLSALFLILIFSFANLPVFGDSVQPDPYEDNEFPQWAKDLRRTEIITLGSVPFTTLLVSLGYGTYMTYTKQLDKFPSPFKMSVYTEDQQKQIFLISLSISAGIGLTDFTYNFIKHSSAQFIVKRRKQEESITILPVFETTLDDNDENNEEEHPLEELQ